MTNHTTPPEGYKDDGRYSLTELESPTARSAPYLDPSVLVDLERYLSHRRQAAVILGSNPNLLAFINSLRESDFKGAFDAAMIE